MRQPSRTLARIASARTANKPVSEAALHTPPANGAVRTPPTTDSGSDASISPARRQLATAACRSRKTPTSATAPYASVRAASARAMVAFPNTSAWYSYGIGIRARRECTAETTAAGSPDRW